MEAIDVSKIFSWNIFFWNIFGLWGGKTPTKYYKCFSFLYLTITLLIYNILLTINLYFTPREIELLIQEVIFYFTEVIVIAKVITIIVMKAHIIETFNNLDCKQFQANTKEEQKIIKSNIKNFKTYWKVYILVSCVSYSSSVFVPIIVYYIFNSNLKLPICNYYFLSDVGRETYFVYWYIYQSIGILGHMYYNLSVDSFIAGMLMMAVTQVRVLQLKLQNLNLSKTESKLSLEVQDCIQIAKLKSILKHYDMLLMYCKTVQNIISIVMFVQFGITSAIICVVLSGLLLPSSMETKVFLVFYLVEITSAIFVPAFLGAILSTESQKLALSAYESEWIERSESFKKCIKIFVERANTPIVMTGMNMMPLSLETFTSIMKSAYSFFTLVRNIQDTHT